MTMRTDSLKLFIKLDVDVQGVALGIFFNF